MPERMPRVVGALVASPVAGLAGAYLGAFVFRLAAQGLFYLAVLAAIVLHVLGIETRLQYLPGAWIDPLRTSETLLNGAALLGGVAAVVALLVTAVRSSRASSLAWLTGMLVAPALVAGGIDRMFGVTPYLEHLIPAAPLAADAVTCRLTVQDVASLPDAQSGCVAEVTGVLTYSAPMRRFELQAPDDPAARVQLFVFRGTRTSLLSETPDASGRPRFYAQVEPLIGTHVRVVGTAVLGQLDADVSRIVPAGDGRPVVAGAVAVEGGDVRPSR